MTRHVVVVSAGLGVPSSTRLLADRLAAATEASLAALGESVATRIVELRPLAHPLADHLLTGFPAGDLVEAVAAIRRADAVIAVTPVFSASYSGLFKSFFDVLEPGTLAGTPVLLAATAGTARHSLALEHALRPLFAYHRALTVPTAVFAASEDFGSAADGRLADRVARAAGELADLVAGRPLGPEDPDPDGLDDLDEPEPFETLLGR
ncbi:CE1759 family FMN reductase [Nocardioides donggukensis]|uniref:NAD(P)H-dependent oxidoreductase n=1 Tax=Nocardioides donggukensis TaxID=2774019 RepID=A0A927K2Q7_9ACTN|nr:CE1759 family FMN reductase [Nocardioides donggukensis]MBD8869457.1 NAD(P)H-dependent oxidoreductase [Nocardioides donggukensis]